MAKKKWYVVFLHQSLALNDKRIFLLPEDR